MSIRHVSDHRSEPLEQQPENGEALAAGPAQTLSVVMEDGASDAALEPGEFRPVQRAISSCLPIADAPSSPNPNARP
jgi:hypothetical protein